jgi:chromosome segregation ATPase
MKSRGWGWVVFSVVMLAGCATGGRNYQTDIDALNARVNALQGQLSAKDQELSTLQNRMNDERMAREAAEAALRKAENDRAALESESKKAASSKAYASDLK